ncbi:distal tail protein Dit [Anaerotignum propionicum]|uniref:distal tail protein Dit n=1 Tax=Anaerotignum propionicum TaxID=28446 RepID=UPI00210E219A|nr:distal tail protein Dit [Anaerotignum propionicum]MCQ4936772.1 phage tail family protein [Anaerotignum propionicum]
MQPYFTFKGIRSTDMGIIVTKVPPITKPERTVSEIKIPGRNGVLHNDEGTYLNYTKEVECAIKNKGKNVPQYAEKINAWLDGYGEITFSNEPDKSYRVMVKNQMDMNGVLNSFSKFLIQFDCFPFKYSVNKADEEKTLTTPATIYNQGTIYSEPIITVYGTGNVTITINGTGYTITGISGYVTINSEIQEVYKDTTNKNNSFSALDFPRFQVGANTISWTGSVTRLEIKPNWRWL